MARPLGQRRHVPLRPHEDAATEIFSIDTPPPTVSGALHPGHVCSYTHTDLVARYRRMRATRSSTRWGGTTTASTSSAACSSCSASRATRRCRTTRRSSPPDKPPKQADPGQPAQLRRACASAVTEQFEQSVLRALVDARPVGRLAPDVHHDRREGHAHLAAGFLALLDRRSRLPRRGADAVGRRLQDRRRAGRARGPRAARRVPPARVPSAPTGEPRLHRDHASRAARRVRRARRPSRRRALPAAVRHRGHHAAVRRARSRSSPTSSPIPRRAPASR